MSKINISPNLFLEVNELNRLIEFLGEDGYKPLLKQLIKTFGIVQNENNDCFKVSLKNDSQNKLIVKQGVAFDSNLNKILLDEDKELDITDIGVNQWIVISYTPTNNEKGLVNISQQGSLSGIGTKFKSVLRGQPNFPTKVKFDSLLNLGEYEVVDVASDTEATLVGSFVAENGIKYQVIGTFTPGFQPDDEYKTIYEYDSCEIDIIESETVPTLLDNQYIIAKVSFEDGEMVISDERIRNLFNYEADFDEYLNVEDYSQSSSHVSLRKTKLYGNLLDIQFEWGYTIEKFRISNISGQSKFDILNGNSKFILSNIIPSNIFKGWLLVNRKNMVSAIIDHNDNNSLYITNINPLIITNDNDEFVIVPNAKDIEIEATVNILDSDESNDTKNFFKFSIENVASHFYFPIDYGRNEIKLRYRIISSTKSTNFKPFSNTHFTNIENKEEILGDSSFIVNYNRPEEIKRNYS